MQKETAEKIVEKWKKNEQFISNDYTEDEKSELPYIKNGTSIKIVVARSNKQASDALWDGKYTSAINLLVKFGIKKLTDKYQKEAKSGLNRMATATRNRKLAQLQWEAQKESNWKVCK